MNWFQMFLFSCFNFKTFFDGLLVASNCILIIIIPPLVAIMITAKYHGFK